MMNEDFREVHRELLDAVYDADYYVNLLPEDCSVDNEAEMILFWHEFWYALPDSPAIHRGPFYRICEVAEGIFE